MSSVEELCDNISLIDKSKIVLQGNVDEIRAAHATGTYRVVTKTNLYADSFDVHSEKETHHGFEYVLKSRAGESNNVLLGSLMTQSELFSFEEVLPTMNDIFIETVTTKPKQS
jgi:ABC-2 type transport system ATP-binding protein